MRAHERVLVREAAARPACWACIGPELHKRLATEVRSKPIIGMQPADPRGRAERVMGPI